MDDLVGDFTADVRATYDRLLPQLETWETDPSDAACINAAFRFAHTVHGNAGFLKLDRFGRLAAAAEEMLALMRSEPSRATTANCGAVLAIIHRIGMLAKAFEEGVGFPADDETSLVERLGICVPAPRTARVPSQGGATIRLPARQFEQLATTIEQVAAAHRQLLSMLGAPQDPKISQVIAALGERILAMDRALSQSRVQPVSRVFSGLDRIVAQTSEMLGKSVKLNLAGGDLMIDREVVDGLRDALLHLVRNALDHGIETPEARTLAEKPISAILDIRAEMVGRALHLTIADDGAGLDRQAIAKSARGQNVHLACDPCHLTDLQMLGLLCTPGISSARQDSQLSGRGVGLDAVRAIMQRLNGQLALEDCTGGGVTFTLTVPLRHIGAETVHAA